MSRWAEIFARLSVGHDTSDTLGHIERPSPEVSLCVRSVNAFPEQPKTSPSAAEQAAMQWGEAEKERAPTVKNDDTISPNRGKGSAPLAARGAKRSIDIAAPLRMGDGRRFHLFRADAIGDVVPPEGCTLLEAAHQFGAVVVADGWELHVVEREHKPLPSEILQGLRAKAGAVIAALRGEHRRRTSGMD